MISDPSGLSLPTVLFSRVLFRRDTPIFEYMVIDIHIIMSIVTNHVV